MKHFLIPTPGHLKVFFLNKYSLGIHFPICLPVLNIAIEMCGWIDDGWMGGWVSGWMNGRKEKGWKEMWIGE